MDLSWCIICDRHCTGDNLYCSESCRFQDNNMDDHYKSDPTPTLSDLKPFLYSFQSSNRKNITTYKVSKEYTYYPYRFTSGSFSESSIYSDDT